MIFRDAPPPRTRPRIMTISAAGISRHVNDKDGITAVADRMVYAGSIEHEADTPKITLLLAPNGSSQVSVICLFAGDAVAHHTVAASTKKDIIAKGIESVEEAADLYSFHYSSLRKKRAANKHLDPVGLKIDDFFSRQLAFNPDWFTKIAVAMSAERLGAIGIIAGTDKAGAHIYTVGEEDGGYESTLPKCYDDIGYVAVGTGSQEFLTALRMGGYTKRRGNLDNLLLMYLAKKRSEVAPFVGPFTDVVCIDDNATGFLLRDQLKRFDEYCKEISAAENKLREDVVARMMTDCAISG